MSSCCTVAVPAEEEGQEKALILDTMVPNTVIAAIKACTTSNHYLLLLLPLPLLLLLLLATWPVPDPSHVPLVGGGAAQAAAVRVRSRLQH